MLRWIQVQANDIGSLLFKLRIITSHVPIQAPMMRFQIGFLPDLPDQILAHVHPPPPFCAATSAWLRRLAAVASWPRSVPATAPSALRLPAGCPGCGEWRQPYDPFLEVTPLPQGDGRGSRVELLLNRASPEHRDSSRLRPASTRFAYASPHLPEGSASADTCAIQFAGSWLRKSVRATS